ncbi:hypothetical protein WG907_01125 [Sphingobium sp. AN558]
MTNGSDERRDRLAKALRDNLRRRKAQARASEPVEPDRGEPAGRDDQAG